MPDASSVSNQANTRGVPVVRSISWPATIPQLATLSLAVTVGWLLTRSVQGVFFGSMAYLIYSYASRLLLARYHRQGVRRSRAGQFREAIPLHQQSYEFFSRHTWLDRYRAITMMSPSAMSYREMALINIAFAHSQLGDGKTAKAYYERALQEFPQSGMARAALRFIHSVENSNAESLL
ncbi:MAG: hypothetical protein RIS70_913 [Planctomycetota bacterium]|jgi:tetratricopeptide (TPR) repeat protein